MTGLRKARQMADELDRLISDTRGRSQRAKDAESYLHRLAAQSVAGPPNVKSNRGRKKHSGIEENLFAVAKAISTYERERLTGATDRVAKQRAETESRLSKPAIERLLADMQPRGFRVLTIETTGDHSGILRVNTRAFKYPNLRKAMRVSKK